jgi:hypothetical protein
MATVHVETHINASPGDAWDALRDFGALHTRLVPGFVTNTVLEGNERVVTFGNGFVAREMLIAIDDERRRLAYSVRGPNFAHHNASAQVFPEGDGVRFVWVADFLPDEMETTVGPMMAAGLEALRRTLEAAATRAQVATPRDRALYSPGRRAR